MRFVALAAALALLPACDDSPPDDQSGDVLTAEDCAGVAGSGAGMFTRETPMSFVALEEADRFCRSNLAPDLGCYDEQPLEFVALLAVDGQLDFGGVFVPTTCNPPDDYPPTADLSLLCDEFGERTPTWKWQWEGLCGENGFAAAFGEGASTTRNCDAPSIIVCYAPSRDTQYSAQ